jgi:hypothetical protein
MFWLALACSAPPTEAAPTAPPTPNYGERRAALERDRVELAAQDRSIARPLARDRLRVAVRDELTPFWFGTPWDFHGTSTTPGEGRIACGYFVSTVLEHAGLQVERVALAQQASEHIVKTFADEADIARFRRGDPALVVEHVRGRPDGVYAVGLDFHVGLLVKRGDAVEFCHSAWTSPRAVTCADPLLDPGFVSKYHVVGPVTSDRAIDAWLDGAAIPTVTPR